MKSIYAMTTISSALMLSGCANLNSIYHRSDFDRKHGGVVSVDARQRMVISNRVDDQLRVCAEQFPDVFTVLSASLSGGGSFSLSGTDNQAEGTLAALMNEGGSTISRTQTVNLLRESMYRTCERYMSGAIGQRELSVQAARDVQAMVAILAIEQLTGVVTPPSTTIGFDASASAAGDAAQITGALDTARKSLDTATENLSIKEAAWKASLGDGKETCAELEGAPDSEKAAACTKAKEEFDAAKVTYDEQKQHYDLLVTLSFRYAQAGSTFGASGVDSVQNDASPKGSYLDEPKSIEAVTKAVTDIVRMTVETDLSNVCEAILLRFADKELSPRQNSSPQAGTEPPEQDTYYIDDLIYECLDGLAVSRKNPAGLPG